MSMNFINYASPDGSKPLHTDLVEIGGNARHVQYLKLLDGTADGTQAIGGDATNGLDVDVTRIVPGTAATHLGKAEDAVHTSGDTGVMLLGVRNNNASTTFAATNGDYTPIAVSGAGEVFIVAATNLGVEVNNSVDVSGSTVDLSSLSGVHAEDSGHLSGDMGFLLLGVRNNSAATVFSNANGDYTPIAVDGGGQVFVTFSATPTVDTELAAASALSDAFTNPTTAPVGACAMVWNGLAWLRLLGGASGVSVGAVIPGTGATALGKAEDAGHTSGDTGVFALGVRNDALGTNFATTNGDYSPISVGPNGEVMAASLTTNEHVYNGSTRLQVKKAFIDSAAGGNISVVALVASKKIRVISAICIVDAVTAIKFTDGSGGSALTPAFKLAANGGFELHWPEGYLCETSAGVALFVNITGTPTVNLVVNYIEV